MKHKSMGLRNVFELKQVTHTRVHTHNVLNMHALRDRGRCQVIRKLFTHSISGENFPPHTIYKFIFSHPILPRSERLGCGITAINVQIMFSKKLTYTTHYSHAFISHHTIPFSFRLYYRFLLLFSIIHSFTHSISSLSFFPTHRSTHISNSHFKVQFAFCMVQMIFGFP